LPKVAYLICSTFLKEDARLPESAFKVRKSQNSTQIFKKASKH